MTFTRREPRGILTVCFERRNGSAQLLRSFKYRRNASFHSGISTPQSRKLAGDRTEYAGRGAGRDICWLLTGRTSVDRPASFTISCANSNHEQSPALVTCTIPLAFLWQRSTIAFARSPA